MGTTAKVLIAEQDQSVIRLLKTVLTNAGHRVVLAKTSEKAAEAIDEYEIDVALVDSSLEGAGGMELARKLKKERPEVVVAFLSYFGSKRSALAANDAGVDRFILKPFDDLAAVNRTIKEIFIERFERTAHGDKDGDSDDATTADDGEQVAVRVIVADTSKEEISEISEALEALHCNVTTATCAQEALLQLSKDEQDVLVVAFDMGDMTADDVLLRAKRLDAYVSVVVTAPEPNLAMTTNLIKKGASGFIEKPLKDPKRTAESIVRRGLAVVQLREEIAQEEEQVEAEEKVQEAPEHEDEETEAEGADDSEGEGEEDEEDEEAEALLKPDTDYELPETSEDDSETSEHDEVAEDHAGDEDQASAEDDGEDEPQEDLAERNEEDEDDERDEDEGERAEGGEEVDDADEGEEGAEEDDDDEESDESESGDDESDKQKD